MQTSLWIAYSDSTYFSEQLSYKILHISSYELKDMNLASFTHLQQFSAKWRKPKTFLTGTDLDGEADERARELTRR
jgi:hypothetical protein